MIDAKVSKIFKKTFKMEFILVKLQTYSVQIVNLLQTDFTKDHFWKMF